MYKHNSKINFKKALSIVFNDNTFESLTISECIDKIRPNEKDLALRWRKSHFTDFSIYQDPKYLSEGFLCYHFSSEASTKGFIRYFDINNIPNWKNFDYLDDNNGVGLTTLLLMEKELNVCFHNTNKNQEEAFQKLCNFYNFKMPNNDLNYEKKYDVVFSFEVAEHYVEPKKYIDQLIDLVKPNKYLVYATGFKDISYPGHYPFYIVDGEEYEHITASKMLNDYLLKYFIPLYSGFNGKPSIFKKR